MWLENFKMYKKNTIRRYFFLQVHLKCWTHFYQVYLEYIQASLKKNVLRYFSSLKNNEKRSALFDWN